MKKNILLCLFILFIYISGYSYPRFSAYTGDKCSDCHVNPAGGTMRNLYGIKYAKQNLQLDFLRKYTKNAEFNPQLNKNISVGGDVRILAADNRMPSGPHLNTFLTMQGDLYLNAELNKYISVFVSPGIQIPNYPVKYEVYGMVSNLPLNSYIKAGRFTPNYGIRIVEHRAFQRQDLLFTPYSADAGFEFGISPGVFNFSVGLFNGLRTDFLDNDPKKMFVASSDVILSTKDNNINVNFGASFYNNPYNFISVDPIIGSISTVDANRKAYAGFTKIGLLKRIALLGEVDFVEDRKINSTGRSVYGFGELNIKIINGLEFRSQIEYVDPDRSSPADLTRRYSIGAAVFPLLGLETEAMVRFISDDRIQNTSEIQCNFHFYF